MLKNWQNQVDYSTVELYISEVERLTEKVENDQTYWERLGDEFMINLKAVGVFFTNAFRVIVAHLPVLLIISAMAVLVLLLIKRYVRAGKKNKLKIPSVNEKIDNQDGK